jgi:tetratricopeptide (TPR) repeat protein
MIGAWRLVAAWSLMAAGMGWADIVHAQAAAKPSAAKNTEADKKAVVTKPDAAAAQKLIEAGIAALEAGKVENAIASLSSGIGSGSLPGSQMARALYYRGVAYRQQGKPALAIADLTSALWLRGGLTGNLRQEALQARAAAYREAGLPDQSAADAVRTSAATAGSNDSETKSTSPAETGAAKPASTGGAKSSVAVAPGGTFGGVDNFFSSLFGSSTPAPAPAPATAASAPPPPASATSSWRQGTEVKQTAAATAEVKQALPAKAWSETTTSSITPAAAAGPSAARTPPPQAAPPALRQDAPAENPPRAAGGRYRLQVAAVRSEAEAQALAARVREKHGADIGALRTEIDQTVVGNMGTLYRVRLGPFADANEPRALCARLKGDGLDCLIVTQ